MSNTIKYSEGSESLALNKGNWWIGTGDSNKGPSDVTGYYAGVTPPSSGYTIYIKREDNLPSIFVAQNDQELINLTNLITESDFSTVQQCLIYYQTQDDKLCVNREIENIVTDGLVLNLDAGYAPSYPTSGTTWYDLSGNSNDGTLVNGTIFSGGSMVFDGVDDYVNTTLSNQIFTDLNCSLEVFLNTNTIKNNTFTTIAGQRSGSDAKTILGLWIEARNSWPGNYFSNYGVLGITFGTAITNEIAIKSPPGFILNNTWYHIVLVSSTTDTKLYINGILISTITSSGTLDKSISGTFGVGCYGITYSGLQYSNNLSNQNISVTRVYNKSLSQQEVLQNFNAQKDRFGL